MALSLGCWDFISKPIDFVELELRVKNALELKSYKDSLEEKIIQRTKELKEAYNKIKKTQLEIVRKLGKAAEFRDDETGEHIIRTSKYVQILARELGLPSNECELFYYAAPMHDIGKIGIPDMILLKPGQLTKEEFEIVKLHTIIGAEILSGTDLPLLEKAKEVALTHHEKWDGTGYPEGLKGEEIPLYKKAWPLEKALDYIKENAGAHFDPDLVMVFFEALDEILTVRKQYQKPSAKPKLIDILEKIKEYHTKTLKTS